MVQKSNLEIASSELQSKATFLGSKGTKKIRPLKSDLGAVHGLSTLSLRISTHRKDTNNIQTTKQNNP